MKTAEEIRRYKLGLLVEEFGSSTSAAEKTGKSAVQISQWLNASKDSKTGKPRSISGRSAREIEAKTGKPRGWMDELYTESPISSGLKASETNRNEYVVLPEGKIPLISWVRAGSWDEPIDNYHVGDAEDWVLCPPNCKPAATFALVVTGESMDDGTAQGYRDGELIYVDGSRINPEHNADVVVRNGSGKVTFKRLVLSNGDWYLKPLNPDWPEKIIQMDDAAHIVGRVVFSGKVRI